MVMAVGGGWLLPVAEPYRTSRVIGERLAKHAADLGVEPVLGSYHEPAVVYSIGKPTPIIANRMGWLALMQTGKPVVAVLMPFEMSVLRREASIAMDVLETQRIFIMNKAQFEVVQFVRVRPSDKGRRADRFAERTAAKLERLALGRSAE